MIQVCKALIEAVRESKAKICIKNDTYYEPFYLRFYITNVGDLVLTHDDYQLTADEFCSIWSGKIVEIEFI